MGKQIHMSECAQYHVILWTPSSDCRSNRYWFRNYIYCIGELTVYLTILYYTILYYTILYYTILYYTILYYTTFVLQLLPVNSLYASPLNIRLLDERLFGWKPLVGVHSVSDVHMLHSGPHSGPRDLFSIARGASSSHLSIPRPQTYTCMLVYMYNNACMWAFIVCRCT